MKNVVREKEETRKTEDRVVWIEEEEVNMKKEAEYGGEKRKGEEEEEHKGSGQGKAKTYK